jgi:hypothetical protein
VCNVYTLQELLPQQLRLERALHLLLLLDRVQQPPQPLDHPHPQQMLGAVPVARRATMEAMPLPQAQDMTTTSSPPRRIMAKRTVGDPRKGARSGITAKTTTKTKANRTTPPNPNGRVTTRMVAVAALPAPAAQTSPT